MATEPTISKQKLTLNLMNKATYDELVDSGQLGLNEICFIDEPNIDAEEKTIIRVAKPVNITDATNKEYVDDKIKFRIWK